jgi:hypothetical protein
MSNVMIKKSKLIYWPKYIVYKQVNIDWKLTIFHSYSQLCFWSQAWSLHVCVFASMEVVQNRKEEGAFQNR